MKAENIRRELAVYGASHLKKCKQIYFGQTLTDEIVAAHKKYYAPIASDEEVLLIVDKIPLGWRGRFFMGLCITDRFVYYKLMKDTFFAPFQSKIKGIIPLENIREMTIGKSDHAYGAEYQGHQLVINNSVVGLLKMGNGLSEVEDMVEQLRHLFNNFCHE